MHERKTRDHRTNDQQFLAFANGMGHMVLKKFKQGSWSHEVNTRCVLTSLLGGRRGVRVFCTLENLGACLF